MKNLITLILCLIAINAMAQTNDTIIAGIQSIQILPNKDKITVYEERPNLKNGDTYKPSKYFIQNENELGEVLYKKPIDFVYDILELSSIDFVNTQKGILFFSTYNYGTSITTHSTNDGGTTWKQVYVGASGVESSFKIVRINEDVVLVYFQNNARDIYITHNGGMTWQTKILNAPKNKEVANGTMKVDFDKKGKITATCNYTDNENKKIGTQKFISKDFGKTFK